MATWLVRDDYNDDGGPQEVAEIRAFPTQEGVSGAVVWSYGYGGGITGTVRLVLDGSGGMTFDPETYAARMMLDVWVPNAPAGRHFHLEGDLYGPGWYGVSPLTNSVRIDLGDDGLDLSAWVSNDGVTTHAVRRFGGDWQPGVPVAAGLEVDAEGNTLITMTLLEGVVMISDGAVTVAVPTGVPLYDGTSGISIVFYLDGIVSVDYLQVSGVGGGGGGGGSAFWTNFVQSFEVP